MHLIYYCQRIYSEYANANCMKSRTLISVLFRFNIDNKIELWFHLVDLVDTWSRDVNIRLLFGSDVQKSSCIFIKFLRKIGSYQHVSNEC